MLMPFPLHQFRNSCEINSGPLSQRMLLGLPFSQMIPSKKRIRRDAGIECAAFRATATRSQPSMISNTRNLRLLCRTGKDPLRYLIETKLGLKIKNIKWLKSDESYKKYGVELGMHGHRGANGSRGSAQIFEKAVGKAITAHTHTASIMRTIFTVGIGGAKDQGYNKGLSSWTRTSALLYPNGNVQLINFLDYKGDYRWKID